MTRHTEAPRTVYFIRPIGMQGPIKIGCSVAPDGRRATLETWSPFPLEIIAEVRGSMQVEMRFHTLFRDLHRGREWFDWSPALEAVIEAIRGETFDIATLPEPRALPRPKRDGNGWTDRTKRLMSYCTRIRHTERKSGRHLSSKLACWRLFLDDPDKLAPVDAFLLDPLTHGLTDSDYREEKIAHLRSLQTPFAERLIEQLRAAA